VSGASAYRDGEWLYQDWLYDDHGAQGSADQNAPVGPNAFLFSPAAGTFTYPTGPGYEANAADLVELRVKPLPDSTAFRITLNTLENPKLAAFTIALGGTSGVNIAWPHGAGVSSPAERFLTWHGNTAELTSPTGQPLTPAPAVSVDTTRRQIDVRIPHSAWNPGTSVVRMTIGVGLWNDAAGTYLAPQSGAATATTPGGAAPTGVAIVNVGPRLNNQEPNPDVSMVPTWTLADSAAGAAVQARWWRESAQAAALRLGDVSPFFANVDFAKLSAGANDDSNVPKTGSIDRILASHYQFGQGFNPSNVCFDLASSFSAGAKCIGRLAGQLQSYALYVPPDKPQPPGGWGMTLLLHSLSANYNQYSASRNQSELGERGPGSLVLTPGGRGPDGFYAGVAEADTFEAWADVARHYQLDPQWTTVSGYSMGGFGTYRLLARWPDLFSRGFSTVGVPGAADPQVPALRNTPIMAWNDTGDELVPVNESEAAEQHLASAGLRFIEWLFTTSDHLTLATNDEYTPAADFLGTYRVDRDPAHVTYVVQPSQDSGVAKAVADHAYWVSNVRARDLKASPTGTIDVRSEGFGVGDPSVSGVQQGAGTLNGGYHGPMPYVSREQDWGTPPRTPVRDALDIHAVNVANTTIDPARARVDCGAQLNVTSDGPVTIDFPGCGARTFAAGRSSRVLGTCTSLRRFRVPLPHRRGTRVVRVAVFVANKRVGSARARGAHRTLTHVVVNLRGLPPGTFHVRLKLRVVTRGGRMRTLTRRHTYHTCVPGRRFRHSRSTHHRRR
jgi:dienelactone hydrolase